jgi:hypothetical protein
MESVEEPMKHTPKPWSAIVPTGEAGVSGGIYGPGDTCIADIYSKESGICEGSAPLEVAQGNARLMELSPIMLEVLRDLMDWGGSMEKGKLARRMSAVKKAREIIAMFERDAPS